MEAKVIVTTDLQLKAIIADAVSAAFKYYQPPASDEVATEPQFGSFDWFVAETNQPSSSARQQIARNEVPGVSKIGKRLLFDKAVIRRWIKDHQRKTADELEQGVDNTFTDRMTSSQNGGRKAAA